jgi:ankyrin repeat protein
LEYSVLHLAAARGNVNIIKMFKNVLHFQEINPLDKSGEYTPMSLASQYGKIEVVKYYIQNESEEVWNRASNTTRIHNTGIKPLHRAAL